jgi:hypothetical protein
MVHCGYEPTASLGLQGKLGDTWKNLVYNFGPRPRPKGEVDLARVFDGVSADEAKSAPKAEALRR